MTEREGVRAKGAMNVSLSVCVRAQSLEPEAVPAS